MFYKAIIHKEMLIEAPTEEEALDEVFHRFDLDTDEVEITCVGEE